MQVSKEGLDLIKKHEGYRDNAYLCPAKVWTIGYGNTFYESGRKVKEGDVIFIERNRKHKIISNDKYLSIRLAVSRADVDHVYEAGDY